MKKTSLIIVIIIVLALLSACAGSSGDPVLSVGGKEYTKAGLEKLETMTVDYTNKDGETTAYTGVVLTALLDDAGVTNSNAMITFIAGDGYEAEIAMADLTACSNCILAFDDDSLRTVMPDMSGKLQVKDVVEISGN